MGAAGRAGPQAALVRLVAGSTDPTPLSSYLVCNTHVCHDLTGIGHRIVFSPQLNS